LVILIIIFLIKIGQKFQNENYMIPKHLRKFSMLLKN